MTVNNRLDEGLDILWTLWYNINILGNHLLFCESEAERP